MAYGQRIYTKTKLGTSRYTIAQIGCFLTSFSNLILRMAHKKRSPPDLNTRFNKAHIYLGDGDLYWGAIAKYSPNFTVTATGGASIPPNRNAIVKLKANNGFGTHFCLVRDIVGSTVYIVDSWDGQVKKSSVYGPIIGWATYKYKKVV